MAFPGECKRKGSGVLGDEGSPAEAGDQACLVEPIGPAVILISLIRTEKLKWWIPSRQQTGKNTRDTDKNDQSLDPREMRNPNKELNPIKLTILKSLDPREMRNPNKELNPIKLTILSI